MRFIIKLVGIILLVFIFPALASMAHWALSKDDALSWRTANWTSSGLLASAQDSQDAVIYFMAARTGRLKGALSVHSWIVTKAKGSNTYNRYDVVGWGTPVRRNAYAPDANWFSNPPTIIKEIRGQQAEALIPRIESAIAKYPFHKRGDYIIWPGPNSNSFVAYVLNEVPELDLALPSIAVGRDYLGEQSVFKLDPDWRNLQVNLFGYGGFAIGERHGFEVNFLGLVTGFDIANPALKLPGFGRITAKGLSGSL